MLMAMVIETGPGPAASARDEFALDLRPSGVRYRGSSCRSACQGDAYDCEHDGVAVRAGLTPAYE